VTSRRQIDQSKSDASYILVISVSTRIIITTNQRIIVINYIETSQTERDTPVGLADWQFGTYRGINNDSH